MRKKKISSSCGSLLNFIWTSPICSESFSTNIWNWFTWFSHRSSKIHPIKFSCNMLDRTHKKTIDSSIIFFRPIFQRSRFQSDPKSFYLNIKVHQASFYIQLSLPTKLTSELEEKRRILNWNMCSNGKFENNFSFILLLIISNNHRRITNGNSQTDLTMRSFCFENKFTSHAFFSSLFQLHGAAAKKIAVLLIAFVKRAKEKWNIRFYQIHNKQDGMKNSFFRSLVFSSLNCYWLNVQVDFSWPHTFCGLCKKKKIF